MKSVYTVLQISLLACSIGQAQTSFLAGNRYFGQNNYVEYRAGNLPIILTAPHGGRLEPTSIPDRTCATCTTVMDANTLELTAQMDTAIRQEFGCFPHVVINHLHRRKLDANRDIAEAALGNAEAETAWNEWHRFIQAAKDSIVRRNGRGLLLDMHGHGHAVQRLEIGYLPTDDQLRLSDSLLSTPQYWRILSIKNLVLNNRTNASAAELLRGNFALGSLLAANGFPAVPSSPDPAPRVGEDYFNGGYNTVRHGSRDSGSIDAIQIECNFMGVRNTYENRRRFAVEVARALKIYLSRHYFGTANFGCATATEERRLARLLIFPNPSSQYLSIMTQEPLSGTFRMRIFGANGQQKSEKRLVLNTESRFDWPLPTLVSGVYWLEMSDANGRLVAREKFVVEQ